MNLRHTTAMTKRIVMAVALLGVGCGGRPFTHEPVDEALPVETRVSVPGGDQTPAEGQPGPTTGAPERPPEAVSPPVVEEPAVTVNAPEEPDWPQDDPETPVILPETPEMPEPEPPVEEEEPVEDPAEDPPEEPETEPPEEEEPEPPKCVPDVSLCNTICGAIDDGCGGELECGGCQPMPATSSQGNVCEANVCTGIPLTPPEQRLPANDAWCSHETDGEFPEAWSGTASGTTCVTLEGAPSLCCAPSSPCLELSVIGCSRKLFNCPSAPFAGCEQVVVQGRLRNEWCCD